MSQQEDDLRALAKIMDLLRGLSIILVVANIYWFCHDLIGNWRFDPETMKVLRNFNESGLFSSPWSSKWWTLLFLSLSCFGTKGVKNEKIQWIHIWIFLSAGAALFFLNWWMPGIGWHLCYIFTTVIGYILMLIGGVYMSRMLKNNMMDDRFNNENESFQQETELLDNELEIVRRTLETRRDGEKMAKLRFEGGLTSELVYQQAKVEYATTATLVPALEKRIEITENSLSLLMGAYPGEKITRQKIDRYIQAPDSVPVGLPSQLLMRRPDVRKSEYQLKSAMSSVGVAYADQFPRLTISLQGGWENDDLKALFRSPFSYVVGNIVGTALDFGRKRAQYKASIAAYEQSRLAYEKKVLEVFTEVNNAVVTYRKMRETTVLKTESRNAALKYIELANLQYRAGSINYIDVLDAQRRFLDAQIGLSNAVRDEHIALVNLYKALGGGWKQ